MVVAAFTVMLWAAVSAAVPEERLICRMTSPPAAEIVESKFPSSTRVIAIADIHGANDELMHILEGAGIINTEVAASSGTCEWASQPVGGTTLIQMGDVVDRGPGASEAWECLEHLQRTAPASSEVIRLVGNHELWWLQGHYHDRNKTEDTKEKCLNITRKLRNGIEDGSIISSHVRHVGGVPVMFVHAGFRREMIDFMKKHYSIKGTADELSDVTNNALRHLVTSQHEARTVVLPRGRDEEIFEAGPERGGRNIGGPFWTDFRVLQEEFESSSPGTEMMQIVGHTAQRGSFRSNGDLSALCIDAAMYTGTSTYLEVGYDNHFRLHIWNEARAENDGWWTTDVTERKCMDSVPTDREL